MGDAVTAPTDRHPIRTPPAGRRKPLAIAEPFPCVREVELGPLAVIVIALVIATREVGKVRRGDQQAQRPSRSPTVSQTVHTLIPVHVA
jgi:hypothetical protein